MAKKEDLQLETTVSHAKTRTVLTFSYNQAIAALQLYAEKQGYAFAEKLTRKFIWWPNPSCDNSTTRLVIDTEPETEPVALPTVSEES